LNILIDWDNLPLLERRKGVKYIVEKVLLAVAPGVVQPPARVSARLYGGWYEVSRPTRLAQLLASDVQRDFPAVLTMPTKSGTHQLTAAAELAYALCVAPNAHLFHTYRSRRGAGSVRVDAQYQQGCGQTTCFATQLHQFLDTKACPLQGCTATIQAILVKEEQKLVDSMLGIDLVHAATTGIESVLVSEDDDLLPMVQYALLAGARIVHVYHTRKPNPLYRPHLKGSYSSCSI